MKPDLLSTLLLSVCCTAAIAQPRPVLVADLLPGANGNIRYPVSRPDNTPYYGSSPRGFMLFKDKVLFTAGNYDSSTFYLYDGISQPEKFTYDNLFTLSINRAVIGDTLYFANRPDNAEPNKYYVFKWDGHNKPQQVSDIELTDSNYPYYIFNTFTVANGILYFAGGDAQQKYALFSYNPKTGVTQRLTDMFSGKAAITGASGLQNLVIFKGKVYFNAWTPEYFNEVYVYDPATNTTSVLANINPGKEEDANFGCSNPMDLQVYNDVLYFAARPNAETANIYAYDGVNPPKRIGGDNLRSVYVFRTNSMVFHNNRVYFPGSADGKDYDLWYYDIKTKQAARAANTFPYGTSEVMFLSLYNDNVVFAAKEAGALYATEGYIYHIPTGELKKMPFPSANNQWFTLQEGFQYKDQLLLRASSDVYGMELYKWSYADTYEDMTVKMFPNPTDHTVNLELGLSRAMPLAFTFTDAIGREVFSGSGKYSTGNNKLAVDVHTWAQGMYFCSIYDSGHKLIWKGKLVKF